MNDLWKRWTINCAIGELIGIACAGSIAFFVNNTMGNPISFAPKLFVLFSMMFAGFIEGFVLGTFQWKVLVTKFSDMSKREWLFYTISVAILGWFLGMLPSLFFIPEISDDNGVYEHLNYSNSWVFALLSIGMGVILGALFGLFQWFSLRNHAEKAFKWIIANSLGWGLGLWWIYLFASIPDEQSSLMFNISMGIGGGLAAGLSVGVITGFYLVKLKKINNNRISK